MFKDAIAEFKLPEGFELVVEPWPYGGLDSTEENRRYFQGLCFARDTRSGNDDSNFYAYPLPLIPVMDAHKKEIVRLDRLATGGKGDELQGKTHDGRCRPLPELGIRPRTERKRHKKRLEGIGCTLARWTIVQSQWITCGVAEMEVQGWL